MLIGHSRPSDIVWSHTSTGVGSSIVTSAARLADGRPDTVTRMVWPGGAQTTASRFNLLAEWGTPISPGLVGISNISLAEGTKVEIAFRRASDTPGTYPYAPAAFNNPQRVIAGPRGEKRCWILFEPGAAVVVGCAIKIWNDVDGVASIPALQAFEFGEAAICVVDEIDVEEQWSDPWIDPTIREFSHRKQPYGTPGTLYRELEVTPLAEEQSAVYGAREDLWAKIDRLQSAVWIPRYTDEADAFSSDMLHRSARIGVATVLPGRDHEAGPYFSSRSMTIIEAPIPT